MQAAEGKVQQSVVGHQKGYYIEKRDFSVSELKILIDAVQAASFITDNIRKGPGTDYARTQYIPVGDYTIVEVKSGKGATTGWGRLKSGAGWISVRGYKNKADGDQSIYHR